MRGDRGVCYIAYGENARNEARESIRSLRTYQRWPVCVIGEQVEGASVHIPFKSRDEGGRWAKVNLDRLSPYVDTLYLDADTRVCAKGLEAGFRVLDNGWDLALVVSWLQGTSWLWHVGAEERQKTLKEIGAQFAMYGGGVFWFRRNPATLHLWATWREEWLHFEGKDQAALLRAMFRSPVKLWPLAKPFNGGEVIKHRWGKARRDA